MRFVVFFGLFVVACASPPPPEPIFDAEEVDAYQTRVEGEVCRLSRECDLALSLPAEDAACRLVVGGTGVAGLWPNRGAHRLDVDEADACVRTLEAFSCVAAQRDRANGISGFITQRCFAAVLGAAADGEACYAPDDCQEGLFCADFRTPDLPDGPCPGRCEVRSACFAGPAECDPSTERCSLDGLSCFAIGEVGDACEASTCALPLQCLDGLCVEPGIDGDDCGDRRCAPGLRCTGEAVCTRPRFGLGEDESCADGYCGRGLFCNGSSCVAEATLGEACADLVADMPQLPCTPDLYCRAELGAPGTCQPRGLPGEVCEPLGAQSGTHAPPCYGACREGVCVPSGEVPRLCERE